MANSEKLTSSEITYDLDFHLIDKNLLNLHFYFLNVEKEYFNKVIPKSTGGFDKKSYMIVRLPQQHLSEKGFNDVDEALKSNVEENTYL